MGKHTDREPIQVVLPWPPKPLHSNHRAKHWGETYNAKAKAREWAWKAAKAAKLPCWPDATIFIEYYPPSYRGDIHNVPSSLKAYIDGIADAMGCDDKAFRVDYPSVWAGKKKGGEVVFRICPTVHLNGVSAPLVGTVEPDGRVVK